MILHCNFEELRALSSGAELILAGDSAEQNSAVAAPAEGMAQVEQLVSRLGGDFAIDSLAEQRRVRSAVDLICENLRSRLDNLVVEYHPGHEEAVANYFDFAHARAVLHRLDGMGMEMNALIELITGAPATDETAESISFPD